MKEYVLVRTKNEIKDMLELAMKTKGFYSGMAYEQGVEDAILWMIKLEADPPIEADGEAVEP